MKHGPLSATLWVRPCPFEGNVSSLALLQELSLALHPSQPRYLPCSSPTARTSPATVKAGTSQSNDIAALDHIWHPPAHLALLCAPNEPCRPPSTYQNYQAMAKKERRRRAAGHAARERVLQRKSSAPRITALGNARPGRPALPGIVPLIYEERSPSPTPSWYLPPGERRVTSLSQ